MGFFLIPVSHGDQVKSQAIIMTVLNGGQQ